MAPVSKTLVIVESPAKARTIAAYLGDDYFVESSIGHIRDLPKRAGDIPASKKKEPWARLGVDVQNGFKPLYIVDPDKRAHITKLKKLVKEAERVLLATDEDREGEPSPASARGLEAQSASRSHGLHEITPKAIEKAVSSPVRSTGDWSTLRKHAASSTASRLRGFSCP